MVIIKGDRHYQIYFVTIHTSNCMVDDQQGYWASWPARELPQIFKPGLRKAVEMERRGYTKTFSLCISMYY